MKIRSLITTMLAIGLTMPASAAYALSLDEIIENTKAGLPGQGNGVYVETHSSANSGGQHAESGETITTGDSYSSSYTETHINSGSDGGNVKVKIETSSNGSTTVKEYSKELKAGEGAKVEVNASSKNGESKTKVKVDDKEVVPSTEVTAHATVTAQVAAASVATASKISTLFTVKIPSIFKKVFAFLWWF